MRHELRPDDIFDHVVLLIPARWRKCGYKRAHDCLTELTGWELVEFRRRFALEGKECEWLSEDAIQYCDVGNKRVFAIAGFPQQVASYLSYSIRLSERAKGKLCLFILGACWKPSV